MSEQAALTDVEREAAQQILREHTTRAFCCHADRGPCAYDGTNRDRLSCDTLTCSKCAPSPWNASTPVWPCGPVLLARRALGVPEDGGCDE